MFLFMAGRMKIILDDITTLSVDAIVNAAKPSLLGGGGVDGAIHRAAGSELRNECRQLNGCRTGEAKITNGYNLKAKYVIHTVGPRYIDGNHNEDILLEECYRNCLTIAKLNNIKTIAFPSISTGVYGYPIKEAVKIAHKTILNFLRNNLSIEEITLVCFSEIDYNIYKSEFLLD